MNPVTVPQKGPIESTPRTVGAARGAAKTTGYRDAGDVLSHMARFVHHQYDTAMFASFPSPLQSGNLVREGVSAPIRRRKR
jgi:hypothetical protein